MFVALRFDTDAAHAERWSDALIEAGALSVDVSDPAAGTPGETPVYGEPGGPDAPYWPISRIEALFAPDADVAGALRDAADALDVPRPPHETRAVADRDWVRLTQSQFGPIAIGAKFWIVATWS